MNDIHTFHAPTAALPAVAEAVAKWYEDQKFEIQTAPMPDGVLLQARQQGDWRKAFGTSSALQVTFRKQGDDLIVEMGAGKWGDKAAAGAVGWFLLWPLAFTAAYGAWQQSKLPDRTFEYIERYLSGGVQQNFGAPPAPPPVATNGGAAPQQAVAPAPAASAQSGGAAPQSGGAGGFCIKCGQPLAPNAVFCHTCGTKVSA